MTRQLVLKQVIVLFYLLLNLTSATANENFAQKLHEAYLNDQPTPQISQLAPNLSEQEAYQIQKNYVSLRQSQETIAGFKAGLTSTAGQAKFSVTQALSGALFSSGHVTDANAIRLSDAGKLMIETEIGFILSKDIEQPITSISSLKSHIAYVVGVIELPDIGFSGPSKIQGIDLIAANVASHQFILGPSTNLNDIDDLNQLTVQLTHNAKQVNGGQGSDALNDQWQALLWLINQLLSQGYQLSAGELLITGALGKMIPAAEGQYQADFGRLGKIDFKISR
ncbi:4-oxalocrotonate decarboxylase [Aliikangiella marina]|uniref:4-oxalocrotonate decarboxylase n=1 Tax=Aliikangiella marina TaxID=1712262 RepID=A0A545T4G3_9GAMM|nr:fumarylacetoacetate hydrolase family protein [Aliikangiella marina]TQV72110.1 4-oxalocrotonate decarboxylase [Aliikangiella marina]